MTNVYRVIFCLLGAMPLFELACAWILREPFGEPEVNMMLIFGISLIGLVLADIREKLSPRSKPEELPPPIRATKVPV